MSDPDERTPSSEPTTSTPPEPTMPAQRTAPPRPPGPFAGVPVGDYLTDVVALVLFLVSLGMPWAADVYGVSATTVAYGPALVVTLLGALSLATHYLVRAGVVPGWGEREAWLVRAAFAVVYVLAVVVHMVVSVVDVFSEPFGIAVGPASGAAFGLAAAILLGLPRRAEIAALGGPERCGRLALRSLAVVGWAIVVLGVAGIVAVVVDTGLSEGVLQLTGLLFVLVGVTLVGAVPILLLASGRGTWRVPVIALGAAFAAAILIDGGGVLVGLGWGGAFVLLPSAVALAAHPTLPWATGLGQPRERGVQIGSHLWQVVVAVAAYAVVFAVLLLIRDGAGISRAVLVAQVILGVFVAGAALVARSVLLRDPESGFVTAAVATGAIALGGLVLLALAAVGTYSRVTWVELFLAFAAPLAVGYAFIGPLRGVSYKEVLLATTTAATTGTATTGWGTTDAAAPPDESAPLDASVPPAPPSAPEHWFTAEQAADPAAPAQVLADIAAAAPELRPAVAANPSAYPGLLEWLGSLGDPDVDAALAARPGAAG